MGAKPPGKLGARAAPVEVEARAGALLQDPAGDEVGACGRCAAAGRSRARRYSLKSVAGCTPSLVTTESPRARRETRVNRFTDWLRPNRLRRPISTKPRGANSNFSSGVGVRRRAYQPPGHLDAAAVAERRGRRFFDGDEQVAAARRAVIDLRDAHAAEQAQRADAALRFGHAVEPERVARLEHDLASHGLGLRALVADDEHVIHEHLLALAHVEAHVGARAVWADVDVDLDVGVPVARGSGTSAACRRDRGRAVAGRTAGPAWSAGPLAAAPSDSAVLPEIAIAPSTTRGPSVIDRRITAVTGPAPGSGTTADCTFASGNPARR